MRRHSTQLNELVQLSQVVWLCVSSWVRNCNSCAIFCTQLIDCFLLCILARYVADNTWQKTTLSRLEASYCWNGSHWMAVGFNRTNSTSCAVFLYDLYHETLVHFSTSSSSTSVCNIIGKRIVRCLINTVNYSAQWRRCWCNNFSSNFWENHSVFLNPI